MKFLILSTFVFILGLFNPLASYASHIDLSPCIKVSHCVKEEWDVKSIEEPLSEIQIIIGNTPRTTIVEMDGDYIHAEVKSRLMKYIDDLEVTYLQDKNKIIIRSESRVGDGDFGVNRKRIDSLKNELFKLET